MGTPIDRQVSPQIKVLSLDHRLMHAMLHLELGAAGLSLANRAVRHRWRRA
ncbi:MAG: hypothetical protein ACJAVS_002458 [Paracoccaceae bacterium]